MESFMKNAYGYSNKVSPLSGKISVRIMRYEHVVFNGVLKDANHKSFKLFDVFKLKETSTKRGTAITTVYRYLIEWSTFPSAQITILFNSFLLVIPTSKVGIKEKIRDGKRYTIKTTNAIHQWWWVNVWSRICIPDTLDISVDGDNCIPEPDDAVVTTMPSGWPLFRNYIYVHGEAEDIAGFDIPVVLDGDVRNVLLPRDRQDIIMHLTKGQYELKARLSNRQHDRHILLELK